MNILNNYIEIFKTDIQSIKKLVLDLSEKEWDSWNHRQKSFSVHSKTKTYPLMWTEQKIDGNYKNIRFRNKILWNEVNPLVSKLKSHYQGEVINVMFANLPSKKFIEPHSDISPLLQSIHRCHLPIQTNHEVVFYINHQELFLEEGIFYEINNTKIHEVKNNSLFDRIHLIVDILPPTNSNQIKIDSFYNSLI